MTLSIIIPSRHHDDDTEAFIAPVSAALQTWGSAGWLTVESKAFDDPEAALGRALKYLKRQWAEG